MSGQKIAEKGVTLFGFTLVAGSIIGVKFTNTNKVLAPTLTISSTEAKENQHPEEVCYE